MKKTQEQKVLEFMNEHGTITRMDAPYIGIANLTAVISEIRKKGVAIGCEKRRTKEGVVYGAWYREVGK